MKSAIWEALPSARYPRSFVCERRAGRGIDFGDRRRDQGRNRGQVNRSSPSTDPTRPKPGKDSDEIGYYGTSVG